MPGAILRDLWLTWCFRAWITYLGTSDHRKWVGAYYVLQEAQITITGGADYRGSLIIAPTHPPLTPLAKTFYLHKFCSKQLPPCHELAIRDHPSPVSVWLYGYYCPRLPEENWKAKTSSSEKLYPNKSYPNHIQQSPPCHELAIRDHPTSVSVCLKMEGGCTSLWVLCPRLPEEESKLLLWFFFRKTPN